MQKGRQRRQAKWAFTHDADADVAVLTNISSDVQTVLRLAQAKKKEDARDVKTELNDNASVQLGLPVARPQHLHSHSHFQTRLMGLSASQMKHNAEKKKEKIRGSCVKRQLIHEDAEGI